MYLIPNNIFTTMHSFPTDTMTEMLRDCMATATQAMTLDSLLITPKEAIEQGIDYDDHSDYLIEELAHFDFVLNVQLLTLFDSLSMSVDFIPRRRARNAAHYFNSLKEVLSDYHLPSIPLTTEQVETLRKPLRSGISELLFFVFYQFNLDKTENTLSNGKVTELNVSVRSYLDSRGESPEKFLEELNDYMMSYMPKITLFEAYPELEDRFLEVVGPYVHDFEAISENLTPEIILEVIYGNYDLESYLSVLTGKSSGS